jgi:nicotinate-nucleotide adenylyltransferase
MKPDPWPMPVQVALFGGSFNPPHIAHQMACLVVLETCAVDQVWMVPTYRHAFSKELCPFEHRMRMCRLAAAAFGDRVEVSSIEADLARPVSRTLDTVLALREAHPDTRFRLVIGADILSETGKWHRWKDIEALAPPIVIGRIGFQLAGHGALGPGYDLIELDLPNVSSTEVRARLARGESAVPLVSRAVMDYIAKRGLYR